MEPEGSLLCSEQLTCEAYPESDESRLQPYALLT
jgi:hypothetical protein